MRKKIRALYQRKGDFKKLAVKYSSEYVPLQFLYKSLFEENVWGIRKKRGDPRIAFNFPSFQQYKKKYAYGNQGLVWDKVEKIKEISYSDFVYDFTVNHSDHNFIANGFVVSNCGVRLLKSSLSVKEVQSHLEKLANQIQRDVPHGVGRGGRIRLDSAAIDRVLKQGAARVVEQGYGQKDDLEYCEEGGQMKDADPETVSFRAKRRGQDQLGTLGAGNHFLEVQQITEIFDEAAAKVYGLFQGQVCVSIHSGSRGLGHQIATDFIRQMMQAMVKYKVKLADPELAAAPFNSSEGQQYFKAMAGGANYAWANRQVMTYLIRQAWQSVLGQIGGQLKLLYDVAHNIAKVEDYPVGTGQYPVPTKLCVHRKGATRALGPNNPAVPQDYQKVGQPVLIPGSMGTASYILAGTKQAEKDSFASVCHGAGRTMSRHQALRQVQGEKLKADLEKKGIIVRGSSWRGLAEEAPLAYKNVDSVVNIVAQAGLAKKVAKLKPLAVIKG